MGLFSTDGFMPRRLCGYWPPGLMWLQIGADLGFWVAYMLIAGFMLYYSRTRKVTVVFPGLLGLYVAFVFFCGLTHFIDVFMYWWPAYRFKAFVSTAGSLVSLTAALSLFSQVHKLLEVRSEIEYNQLKIEKERAEEQLQKAEEINRTLKELLNFKDLKPPEIL